MDTGVIVALGALLVSALGLILTGRRDTQASARETASMSTKLDTIAAGVEDIRVDMRSIRDRVDGLTERIAIVERDAAALDTRVENLENREGYHHD